MALDWLTSSKIFILKFKMLTTISQQQLKWLSLEPIIMHLIYHLLSASPSRFYKSLPPLSKSYGTLCFLTTAAVKLGLLGYASIALEYHPVFTKLQQQPDFQLATVGKTYNKKIHPYDFCNTASVPFKNFTCLLFPCSNLHMKPLYLFSFSDMEASYQFFLPWSIFIPLRHTAHNDVWLARYGVQLERGPFDRRAADFLWMMLFGAFILLVLSAIPFFRFRFLGTSMVFMLVYVWSREFRTAQINIYGLVSLRAFYLPWALLMLDVIFGDPLMPDLLGIFAGHVYYFLAVLHPLATGRNLLKTPFWVHRLVASLGLAALPNFRGQPNTSNSTGSGAFRGRSYRLNR
ncbi:hypothetical protein ZIOFF_013893 [Zingiber officinale]|uniref:Derlin n=1 Tax=Zingiber officinale TaxID=94328 RepID=A0A8J5HNR3_ZINOF|nr:hypothetical protein ZIOFF_013893 [Zingiber officinale]